MPYPGDEPNWIVDRYRKHGFKQRPETARYERKRLSASIGIH
jgi:hypothetical protein